MIEFSHRFGYDGWAILVRGATKPLRWTFRVSRREVRELRKEQNWLRTDIDIVKVNVLVEAVE